MIVGHSQGGIQAVKVLYELAGDVRRRDPVWNPLTDRAEDRDHDHRSVHRPRAPGRRAEGGLRVGRRRRRRRAAAPEPVEDGRPAARDSGHGRGVHRLLARRRPHRVGSAGRRVGLTGRAATRERAQRRVARQLLARHRRCDRRSRRGSGDARMAQRLRARARSNGVPANAASVDQRALGGGCLVQHQEALGARGTDGSCAQNAAPAAEKRQ